MKPNSRSIIVVDPPWETKTWSDKGQGRSASRHYTTMTNQELMDLKEPMQKAFPGDSLLLIWTTGPHMKQAIKLMEHWGWSYRTKVFTWVKLLEKYHERFNKIAQSATSGIPLSEEELIPTLEGLFKIGNGKYTRANPEYVLLGKRGRGPVNRMRGDVRELILAPIMEHSRKPDEANRRIELLLRRPQDEIFELFARRQYKNWCCTGLELDHTYIKDALELFAQGERWNGDERATQKSTIALEALRALMRKEDD